MKQYRSFLFFIIVFALLWQACNSSDESANNTNVFSDDTLQTLNASPKDSITTWEFNADKDVPVAAGKAYFDRLTAQQLVALASTDKVKIELVKIANDTIFVRIPDSFYLSQQMGTTGAKGFISVATFTLTELKGIRYVNFEFTEGDHAVPGTYRRDEFKDN